MSVRRGMRRRAIDGVLLLDKPAGPTSNAALQAVRRLYNAAKGGHTGTLDPLATGLLPLCFGEATKFAGELLTADKTYEAVVTLGVTTDSADAAGRVLATSSVTVTEAQVEQALLGFRGAIMQMPPMHSALKHAGQPLYKYARAGIEIAREPRRVTIHVLRLTGFDGDSLSLTVDCSKGTYIRSLAHDLGVALGCGAHLKSLRRSRIADLHLDRGVTMATLEALDAEGREALLLPVDALLESLPPALLDDDDATRLAHGQPVRYSGEPGRRMRAYGRGRFIGLCRLDEGGWLTPSRLVSEPLAASRDKAEVLEQTVETRV